MLLLAFALFLLLAAFGSWSKHRQTPLTRSIQPLTGLGDSAWYSNISDNDFYNPALIFSEFPRGIFRRTVNPVHRDDGKMRLIGKESSGKFSVYTDAKPKLGSMGVPSIRWYLKSAENRYVEFGERKFWPSFAPAKS